MQPIKQQGGRARADANAQLVARAGWLGSGAAAVVAFAALTLCWVYLVGKDLNWDYVNYHHYGAALMLEDRWQQDYFAASVQSYLNPLLFVPFYWMATAHWHSWLIAFLLAVVHSLNLVVVWRLAGLVTPSTASAAARRAMQWVALALGFIAPLHLSMVGSTFSDPLASLPFMAALWLVVSRPVPTLRTVALAGALMGMATGLKMTNGAMALGLCCALLVGQAQTQSFRELLRQTFVMGLAAVGGLALTHGYWSWKLYSEFGNPVFPLFNAFFASPDFLLANFQDRRFLETGWWGLLRLPFDMTEHATWVYAENYVPDLRVAALVGLVGVWGLLRLFSRVGKAGGVPKPLLVLTVFFVAGFIAWGMSTRIGRYAYPLWIVAGPLLVGWFAILIPARSDWVVAGAMSVLLAQGLVQYETGSARWTSYEWSDPWINIEMPERLKREPVTLVSVGLQPFGVLAPHLHPRSGVVNIVGQHTQPVGDAMTLRLKRMLADDQRPLNILLFSPVEPKRGIDLRLPAAARAALNVYLQTYGIEVPDATCEVIVMRETPLGGFIFDELPPKSNGEKLDAAAYYLVCSLVRVPQAQQRQAESETESMAPIFNALEDACPHLFYPPRVQTLLGAGSWQRHYPNTLNKLIVDGDLVAVRIPRYMRDLVIGNVPALLQLGKLNASVCPVVPKQLWRRDQVIAPAVD